MQVDVCDGTMCIGIFYIMVHNVHGIFVQWHMRGAAVAGGQRFFFSFFFPSPGGRTPEEGDKGPSCRSRVCDGHDANIPYIEVFVSGGSRWEMHDLNGHSGATCHDKHRVGEMFLARDVRGLAWGQCWERRAGHEEARSAVS